MKSSWKFVRQWVRTAGKGYSIQRWAGTDSVVLLPRKMSESGNCIHYNIRGRLNFWNTCYHSSDNFNLFSSSIWNIRGEITRKRYIISPCGLCECETCSFTQSGEKDWEQIVLENFLAHWRVSNRWRWGKIHNDELHNLYFSHHKVLKVGWTRRNSGIVACRETKNEYKSLVQKYFRQETNFWSLGVTGTIILWHVDTLQGNDSERSSWVTSSKTSMRTRQQLETATEERCFFVQSVPRCYKQDS
jgi:hypothetical protein